MQGHWKPGGGVIHRVTDLPRPVCSLHLCLLGIRLCSNTLCEVRKCAQSFLQQLIGAVKKPEAAMDSEDVTCAVSIIYRRGAILFKILEAAWKHTARKWNDGVQFTNDHLLQ